MRHFSPRMCYRDKLKAGVLQLTLGISFVISLLCMSIIMLVYYYKIDYLQKDITNRLHDNAASAIQYGIAKRSGLEFNVKEHVDLFGDGTDSVEILRRPWGIFELYTAVSFQGNHKYTKSALITARPSDIGLSAIYSPDNNAPLYLVGKTSIVGTVYASERKFAGGYIDGVGFGEDKFMIGEIKKSDPSIPALDTILLHEIKALLFNQVSNYKLISWMSLPQDTMLSFTQPEINYYSSNQSIDLEDSLSGNLIIQSAIKIRLTAQCVLKNVIILAPDIDIDKGFRGSVQCFATRSIMVGSESKLSYPSALVLAGYDRDSLIQINRDAIVEGAVVIPGYDQTLSSKAVFKIEKKGALHGMAYINASADIRGSIWGHIMARSFQAKVGGAAYGNYLIDAEINSKKRASDMPATLLWGNSEKMVVAKWIE